VVPDDRRERAVVIEKDQRFPSRQALPDGTLPLPDGRQIRERPAARLPAWWEHQLAEVGSVVIVTPF